MAAHVQKHQEFLKQQGTGAPTSFQAALDKEMQAAQEDLRRNSGLVTPPALTMQTVDQVLRETYLPLMKQQFERDSMADRWVYGRIAISGQTMSLLKRYNQDAGVTVNSNSIEYSGMIDTVRGYRDKGVNVIKQGDFWVAYKGSKVVPFNSDREALLFIASKGNGWRLKSAQWGEKIR